jgi:hypothetical protein
MLPVQPTFIVLEIDGSAGQAAQLPDESIIQIDV